MTVIDDVSIVTFGWSEITGSYNTADTVVRDSRTKYTVGYKNTPKYFCA